MTVDKSTFRIAVCFLGVALIACIGGICTLAALKVAIPDSLTTIAGVVGGALAGLFVTPHSEPQPVTVTDQPVAVTETPAKRTSRRKRDAGHVGLVEAALVALVIVVILILIGALR